MMLHENYNPNQRPARTARGQRGQSIVIALLVLLLLGLAGALFVTIVARNLLNARHANRVITADQYGRAGISYADSQLSGSLDGADWRPALQNAVLAAYQPPAGSREAARYLARLYNVTTNPTGLQPVATADPDKAYLDAGYSRFNTGAGRFLLRVTYDPVNVQTVDAATGLPSPVPPGKYIKIESIGREGNIDPLDPTTYTNNRSTDRTQAYQVAYKPIGITDYARFETNPDKRSDIANLGVISEFYAANTDGGIATPGVSDFNNITTPTIQEYPVLTTYGATDAYLQQTTTKNSFPNPTAGSTAALPAGYTALPGGGSLHANMPVRFFGTNVIYLNDATLSTPANGIANGPLFQDSAEIAGNLLLDSYDQKAKLDNTLLDTTANPPVGQQAALILNPTDITKVATTGTFITPSNDTGGVNPGFDTRNGRVRDGSMQNDANGLPRGITRLEPPLMDGLDSASQLPRYKALTMTSPLRLNLKNPDGTPYVPAANAPSASLYGYGKAIYVDNAVDVQADSTAIGGGSTLTDEWLHGNSAANNAPGAGNWNAHFYNPPGVSITLGQIIGQSGTSNVYGLRLVRDDGNWKNPDGTAGTSQTLPIAYSDLDVTNTNLADNNIVIYTEGNLRVRGIASPNEGTGTGGNAKYTPRHITIVTNGTAYIEGNLLKGDPDSSISVLAHDYVCVNTTQFLVGPNVGPRTAITGSDEDAAQVTGFQDPLAAPADSSPTGINALELTDGTSLLQTFGFGFANSAAATPGNQYQPANANLALYLSAGPPASGGRAQIDLDIFDSGGNSIFGTPPAPTFDSFLHTTLDLSGTALINATGNDQYHLSLQRDLGNKPASDAGALQNPLIERAAILPMDIRFEAVMYAQTRSFFVIPGDWFNSDSGDTVDSYLQTATRPSNTQSVDETGRFPFYNQPIDLKITIDGSVSEARPADIAAQSEWMRKWGWIPQYHGSLIGLSTATTETAGHVLAKLPAIGLQIIYNPQAGYPYNPTATGTLPAHYLRSDQFGRPLPFTPNLPVSTGLLYSGDSSEPPLLQ